VKGKKNGVTIGIIIAIILTLLIGLVGCGSSGGDGKSTCRNCGRSKPLSYAGFCSTCQKGFEEWQDRTYND